MVFMPATTEQYLGMCCFILGDRLLFVSIKVYLFIFIFTSWFGVFGEHFLIIKKTVYLYPWNY